MSLIAFVHDNKSCSEMMYANIVKNVMYTCEFIKYIQTIFHFMNQLSLYLKKIYPSISVMRGHYYPLLFRPVG